MSRHASPVQVECSGQKLVGVIGGAHRRVSSWSTRNCSDSTNACSSRKACVRKKATFGLSRHLFSPSSQSLLSRFLARVGPFLLLDDVDAWEGVPSGNW